MILQVVNNYNYGLWYANNYSIHGVFVNQRSHHWGAPHCSKQVNLNVHRTENDPISW